MNRSTLILSAFMILGALEMRAQDRLLAGPTIGYEFSVPLLLRRTEGAINYDPSFSGTGRSSSHSAIIGGELFVPDALGLLGYSAGLSLFATSGGYRSDPYIPGLSLDDTAAAAFVAPDRYRRIQVDLTAATLVADAQARFSIAEGIVAGAGLWTSYRLSGQFLRTERPEVLPPDISEEEATIVTGGDRIAAHEFSYGGIFTLGALLPVSPSITLMPQLTSRLDAVALRLGMGFQSFTIGAGLSVLFNATSAPIAIVQPPAGSLDDHASPDGSTHNGETRPLRLEARIDLFADGVAERSRPAIVEPEEVVNRVVIALPRVVPYEPNAFDIPGGFARITPAQSAAFTTRSLAGMDLSGHWRNYLNILGLRLRESKNAALTVTGVSTSSEPQSLARVRAEVVRDYLVEVWGIASSRIAIRSMQGGASQVRLDGPDALFSTPLLSQWRTRRYRMPQLGLERFVVADAGVRHWTLSLAQGGRTLASFDSDSTVSDPALDLKFIAGGDSSAAIAPIVATLTVEDSLGRTTTATDELALSRAVRTPSAQASRGERLEVITFDAALDSSAAATERLLAAQRAVRMLRDGAIVTVGLVGRTSTAAQRLRAGDVGRLSEALLAAANERGVRLGRFVAERDGGGEPTPGGIRIVIEQSHEETPQTDLE
jgi:hypothetical protein